MAQEKKFALNFAPIESHAVLLSQTITQTDFLLLQNLGQFPELYLILTHNEQLFTSVQRLKLRNK